MIKIKPLIILVLCLALFLLPSCKATFSIETSDNSTNNGTITPIIQKNKDKEQDKNIYLFEEACFASEVYFTVTKMEIQESPNFAIILTINVEQRHEDNLENDIDITSDMFSIKSTNNTAKIAIGALYCSIIGACVDAGIGLIFGESPGALDIMASTVDNYVDFIGDIVTEAKSSFTIKAQKNQFEPFKPKKIKGSKDITVRFDFTEEQLKSNKLIMLVIDDGSENKGHCKRYIYLIPRPTGNTL